MNPCQHEAFYVEGSVTHHTDDEGGPVTGFAVEITVRCKQCGRPFVFRDEPSVSLDRQTARLPIAPEGGPSPDAQALFLFGAVQRRQSAGEGGRGRFAGLGDPGGLIPLDGPLAAGAHPSGERGLWWLSFGDGNRPEGEQFLGVVLMYGCTLFEANRAAHAVGCNPGGEVQGFPIPAIGEAFIPEGHVGRLLTKLEAETLAAQLDEHFDRVEPEPEPEPEAVP